jgi:hypothetical protein
MGVDDDLACCSLAKDLGQPGNRHHARSRSDPPGLVRVPLMAAGLHRPPPARPPARAAPSGTAAINGRRPSTPHPAPGDRIEWEVVAPQKATLLGIELQQAMNGLGFQAGALAQPLRRPPGRCRQQWL